MKSVEVHGEMFRVIRVPDPLTRDGERYAALVDHEQSVIWIDPAVPNGYRMRKTIAAAKERAASDIAAADGEASDAV